MTLSEFGDGLEREIGIKMNISEGKKEYNKRMGNVEHVFSILKKQHNLNELEPGELDRIQTELNLLVAA